MMFGGGGDEMVLIGSAVATRETQDRKIATLRPTRGKDDLVGFASQQRGDRIPRIIDSSTGPAPGSMDPGGIPENPLQQGNHRLTGLRGEWGGRVVIEIDHVAT